MMFGYLTLFTALIISLSAAVYSILGLTAIFAAAFWPIVVLGGSLEFGKIVTTLWLHKYWDRAELQYKVYLSSAVCILMVLTSMGVFGFLSKAHLDQAVPSGDIQAQVQIFDDKIQTQKDNIKTARAALSQMDTAVDQVMGRSQDEKGADKAVAIRRSQARERTALQNDISKAQTEIARLQEQRAPIASQARQVEAEVGPIKYIAALIYGDNPDANILEKAVRWVIILIVIVFDPLALTLLLAATKTFEWERGINILATKRKDDDPPSTFTAPIIDHLEPVVENQPNTAAENEYFNDEQSKADNILKQGVTNSNPDDAMPIDQLEQIKQSVTQENKKKNVLSSLDAMWKQATSVFKKDLEADHAPLEESKLLTVDDSDDESTLSSEEKQARRIWKIENPGDTIKHQTRLLNSGFIDTLPWNQIEFRERANIVPENQWIQDDQFNLSLQVDNAPTGPVGEMRGFGTSFPVNAIKGDMFLRVDQLPSALYKFNGKAWIEVDKSLSDQHAYDDAYIDHLIEKIDSGEYDPELLSDAERDSIEQRLKNNF